MQYVGRSSPVKEVHRVIPYGGGGIVFSWLLLHELWSYWNNSNSCVLRYHEYLRGGDETIAACISMVLPQYMEYNGFYQNDRGDRFGPGATMKIPASLTDQPQIGFHKVSGFHTVENIGLCGSAQKVVSLPDCMRWQFGYGVSSLNVADPKVVSAVAMHLAYRSHFAGLQSDTSDPVGRGVVCVRF